MNLLPLKRAPELSIESQRSSLLDVIFNPVAGRGVARRRLREVQGLLGPAADFQATSGPGHAEELAFNLAKRGCSTIVAAGGDGTVHEVANGILRAGNPPCPPLSGGGEGGVALGIIPLGSCNDYAYSLGLPGDPRQLADLLLSRAGREVDVGEVSDGKGKSRYFVNTLGLGLSGAVAIEARKIKRLRGLMLYSLAALRAIWRHFQSPDTILTIDDERWEIATLYLSVALAHREGGFTVAPQAELDDGLFDYLHASRMSRWRALTYLPRLARGSIPDGDPAIRRGRCRVISLQSAAPILVHVDGELFARPEDQMQELQIRLLPRRLRVLASQPVKPIHAGVRTPGNVQFRMS